MTWEGEGWFSKIWDWYEAPRLHGWVVEGWLWSPLTCGLGEHVTLDTGCQMPWHVREQVSKHLVPTAKPSNHQGFLFLILCYSYFGVFLSTWSVRNVIVIVTWFGVSPFYWYACVFFNWCTLNFFSSSQNVCVGGLLYPNGSINLGTGKHISEEKRAEQF